MLVFIIIITYSWTNTKQQFELCDLNWRYSFRELMLLMFNHVRFKF